MKLSSNKKKIIQKDMYVIYHYISYLNYITYTFVGTVLFWVLNIPLLLFLLTIELKISTLPFLLLAGIPVGPAIVALFSYLKRVKYNKKILTTFFKAYKKNFKVSILGWGLTLIILGFCGINLLLMGIINSFVNLKWIYIIIMIASITFILTFFLLVSNFKITSYKKAVSLTFKVSIIKSIRCSLNFMIVIGSWFLLNHIPIYLAFFGVGITGLLLILNFEPVFEFIEKHNV